MPESTEQQLPPTEREVAMANVVFAAMLYRHSGRDSDRDVLFRIIDATDPALTESNNSRPVGRCAACVNGDPGNCVRATPCPSPEHGFQVHDPGDDAEVWADEDIDAFRSAVGAVDQPTGRDRCNCREARRKDPGAPHRPGCPEERFSEHAMSCCSRGGYACDCKPRAEGLAVASSRTGRNTPEPSDTTTNQPERDERLTNQRENDYLHGLIDARENDSTKPRTFVTKHPDPMPGHTLDCWERLEALPYPGGHCAGECLLEDGFGERHA